MSLFKSTVYFSCISPPFCQVRWSLLFRAIHNIKTKSRAPIIIIITIQLTSNL